MDASNTADFADGFWNIYIGAVTLISIVGCAVFLWLQGSAKHKAGETTGHVWDGDLAEYNNPMPGWWRWLFYITIVFGLVYLAVYPGLGNRNSNNGAREEYANEMRQADAKYGPIYAKYLKQDVATVAADPEAREMGQRLFLTYCAQCHGSDARGTKGFPNLTDKDWLWGGTPAQITETISKGRDAMMPAKGVKPDLNGDEIKDIAAYVRSLSGLASDSIRRQRGQALFATACAACHGPDGKGAIGLAPNLTDKVWLYGSSEDTIVETVTKGRQNRMPGFGDFLGEAKVHLLAAYVYGLGGGVKEEPTPAAIPVAAANPVPAK